MPKDQEQYCSNCRFFVPDEQEPEGGTCHYHAPRPVLSGNLMDEGIDTVWPWVASGDWCGRWEE